MRTVKLTPKAGEDLENIWHYSRQHFGEIQADRYINHLSEIFSIMCANNIGTPRPELGEYIYALPFERHIIYFIQSATEVIVIRILSHNQDAGKHVNWL